MKNAFSLHPSLFVRLLSPFTGEASVVNAQMLAQRLHVFLIFVSPSQEFESSDIFLGRRYTSSIV
ncbi:hypothetical protein KSD_41940 [Ktedonobacter sp. SOSP1-85]|nr:hypothetical protein KSD_41940 [Ktedonobacter sp. SOSP1-85]